jgi:hypothetical protein|tara:strand:+ start:284 stop:808 length:525 start_codon:yes stop_codon:yes gene_type:complete
LVPQLKVEKENYTTIDNFFDDMYFKNLQDIIMNQDQAKQFDWHFVSHLNNKQTESDNSSYFARTIYDQEPMHDIYDMFKPLYQLFSIRSLIRIKANCYPATENLITHAKHIDYPDTHKGAIIYINTNNGYTILEDGTKIKSIANRVLFFDASKPHSSTNCTNTKARFNINVNYF